MKQWTAKAPAKINLTLDITGVRENGYHELASCFHTLHLADELIVFLTRQESVREEWCSQFTSMRRIPFVVEPRQSPYDISGIFIVDGPIQLKASKNNLILRAIDIFMRKLYEKPQAVSDERLATKEQLHMGVYIEKNIPFEAGLGGGSADAAAVLRILNQIFAYPFHQNDLVKMSLALGMDVPFGLLGGAAELRGVGSEITPIRSKLQFPVLLFKPPQGMPTHNAYAKIDELSASELKKFKPDHESFMHTFATHKYRKALTFGGNIFQAIVATAIPEIIEIQEYLRENGAILSTLCGSGSCSFAIFTNRQLMYRLKRDLQKQYPGWWIKATMLQPEGHKNYLKSEYDA